MVLGNLFQGLSGNMSEVSKDSLAKDYGHLLIEKEEIQAGYALIRDLVIFTNIRILFVDRQGSTGKKARYKSIFLMNIINDHWVPGQHPPQGPHRKSPDPKPRIPQTLWHGPPLYHVNETGLWEQAKG